MVNSQSYVICRLSSVVNTIFPQSKLKSFSLPRMGVVQVLSMQQVVSFKEPCVLIDVRSEAEYLHAHIPKALNLPILNNEERKQVGTLYKQKSREEAIKLGLDFFGPKLNSFITQAEAWRKAYNTKTFIIYCWRGGLRSQTMAWLLNMYGFTVYTIQGGYKAYRSWCLQQFVYPYKLIVLGGFTGSNKTQTLHQLKDNKEAIIDLEELACHRGSTFGQLGMPPQPSNEMFENQLAWQLFTFQNKTIWVEAESQRIGCINLPLAFWATMQKAIYVQLTIPFEERLLLIMEQYGQFEKKDLLSGIKRIEKRLGGLLTKQAIQFLQEDDIYNCFAILLNYYDKYYTKSSLQNHTSTPIILEAFTTNSATNSKILLQWKNQHLPQ